jgi:hypothetical protein
VVDPGHPLMQGVPDPFSGNAASHATFGSLPPGARVIAATTRGEPTLIEYDVGAGRVIAFGQTLEFSFRNGDVGRILENGVPYAYAIEPVVDLPWLTLTPSSGTVQQGASLRIALTIDTAGLTPGLYRARIALVTNDPTNTTILIPVTLVVTDYRVGVNSGGPAYTDRAGDVWAADQLATTTRFGYTNNRSSTARTTNAIASTEDDPLYQRQRVDAGGYRFPGVPSGTYEVELLFAEFDVRRPNQRLFDVYVENTLVLPAFDVYNDVGRFVADHKKFMVTVTDGIANLQLVPRRGYRVPIINGIRVTHRVDRD